MFWVCVKTVRVTQGGATCCWAVFTQIQGLSSSSHHLTTKPAGAGQDTCKGTASTDDPGWTGIPHLVALCSAKRLGRRLPGGWCSGIVTTVNLLQLGNYFYLNPLLFSLLSLQFSPPISLCGERASSCVVFSCHLELSHYSVDG